MKTTIDRATARDVPAMIALLDVLFRIEQDFRPDHVKQQRGLEMLLKSTQTAVALVARDAGGNVIGMVTAQLVISTAEGALSAWIEDMVVAAEYRGQGIGAELLRAALRWAGGQGATRAQLLCDLDNTAAMGFYDRQGWSGTRLIARRSRLAGGA